MDKPAEANCGNRWTSTENSSDHAWNLNNGSWNNNNKTNTNNAVLVAYELFGKGRIYVTYDEVREAWLDCRRHKQTRESCIAFEMDLWSNLTTLTEELNDGTYRIGDSICFVVTRPKLREVFAADFRDRIVHHLLIRKFEEIFEWYEIYDSYACRKGKGIQLAVRMLSERVGRFNDLWVWQGDIQSDFMTIDKRVVWDRLERLIRWRYKGGDVEWWLWLWRMVVFHEPQKRCTVKGNAELWKRLPKGKSLFTCDEYKGLAIGNLSSQHLNNLLLTDLDYYISGFGTVVAYGRYADDFYVIGRREDLKEIMPMVRRYLARELEMTLHPKKWRLDEVRKGVKFVGYVCKGDRIYAGSRLVDNAFGAAETECDIGRLKCRVNSYLGFMGWVNSYAIRRRLANVVWARAGRRASFVNGFRKICITDKFQ